MRFHDDDFEAVREFRFHALGPIDGAFRRKRGNDVRGLRRGGCHYAASFLPTEEGAARFAGARKTIARFSLRKYFFAAACTCSGVTCRNPSSIVFTSCGSPSKSEKHARDRKSTRLNSSHLVISYAVFCLKKKKKANRNRVESSKRIDHTPIHPPCALRIRHTHHRTPHRLPPPPRYVAPRRAWPTRDDRVL